MVPPLSHVDVSSDLLRGFESARNKAAPHKEADDIVIASRILRSLANADSVTWKLLEEVSDISRDSVKELYEGCRLFLNRAIATDSPAYGPLLSRLHATFSSAVETLSHHRNDVSEPGLLSAQTGLAYIESLMGPETSNVVKMDTVNPFLMVHVAAEILHDIDRDVGHRRALFWEEKTDLFKRMYPYCHDLHHLVAVDLQPQEATTIELHTARDALVELYGMIQDSQEAKQYISVHTEQKQHLGILQNYIAPFGKVPTIRPAPTADSKAVALDWNTWAGVARDARDRREARHAAHPELFFPEQLDFIR